MKCPKCGYQSFNHLLTCKKCGCDLAELQTKLGFGQVVVPSSRPLAGTVRTVGEPAPEDAAVAGPLESPAPPVANPPATRRNHEEFPETDTFPDGEEAEDAFPFPFDRMDADLDTLQREDEDSSDLYVLGNAFDEQEEQGEERERTERDGMQGLEEFDPEDFSFSAPPDGQEPHQDEDFFFSFEELNAELTDWEDVPSLPEGTRPENEEIDHFPARDALKAAEAIPPREIAEPDADEEPQSIKELLAPAPEPSLADRCETTDLLPELAFTSDDDWQTGEDALPEGVEQSPDKPVLGRRFSALLADLGVLALVFSLFLLAGEMVRVPTAAQWFRFNADILLDLSAPYFVLLFTLCFGYFTLFHYLVGQTPGKMLKGLRVENPSGEHPSLTQAFLRSTGGLVMLLPAGLGLFSVVTNRGRRGWNDRLANTRVVNKAADDQES